MLSVNDFGFQGFGKVKVPDLLSIKMGEEIFWSVGGPVLMNSIFIF